MCVSAFHLGLKDKLDELSELIENDDVIYHKGYTTTELRKLLIQNEIPHVFNKKEICKLSTDIVNLASEGLENRGIREEIFLNPLYKRIENHTNPGRELIKSIKKGIKIEKIIEDYGKLDIII